MSGDGSGTLAVALRNQVLAAAIICETEVVFVSRFSVRKTSKRCIAGRLHQLKIDYATAHLVIEQRSTLKAQLDSIGLQPVALTLAEAKQSLVDDRDAMHSALYDHLVLEHPELTRFVRLLPGPHRVSTLDWHKTVALLAVALGLAFERNKNNYS